LGKKKPFILIIDNEIENLNLCKNILESNNYSVLTAQHTEDAINIYRQQQNYIYAILLNLKLSEGKTYFFSIPAFFAINENVKIVAMSDVLEKEELSEYYQSKLYDFVKKPVQEQVLLQCLGNPVKQTAE
jgi:DNA-binding NtrC family response regulator